MKIQAAVDRSLLGSSLCVELSERLKISPILSAILISRGITCADDAIAFFNFATKLYSPHLIPDCYAAAKRIYQ